MSDIFIKMNTLHIIIAFGLAFIVAFFTTPLCKKIAFKVGAVAYPNKRSMHNKPMPLAGGLAIIAGFFITVLIIIFLSKELVLDQFIGMIIGGLLIAVLGFFDDIYDLNPKFRLLIQILAAFIVVKSGIVIRSVKWPFAPNSFIQFGLLAEPLTIFWIVGITNAVNFIDGLDGLAAGISSIASICLMVLALISPQTNIVAIIMTSALAGSCLGFLPYNFNPAKIFMGDTGSTFLGFTLSVISIQGLIKSYTAITLILAVIVLGLPIFDTTFAILRRIKNHQSIAKADRGHLHHRLVDNGFSQKKAVLTLYGISGCFGLAGILLAETEITLAVVVLILMFCVIIKESIKYKNKNKLDQ